jgi:hypothetical protein
MRFQKLMWRNMMRSIKSQKASVLHYSIDLQNNRISYVNETIRRQIYIVPLAGPA